MPSVMIIILLLFTIIKQENIISGVWLRNNC